jgi:hypothetical protein
MSATEIASCVMKHISELETNLLPEDDRSFLVAKWTRA